MRPCPLSGDAHPNISILCHPLPSRLQPSQHESGAFPVSRSFASGGQNIVGFQLGISSSSKQIQTDFRIDWFFRNDGLTSLAAHDTSRVFQHQYSSKYPYFSLFSNFLLILLVYYYIKMVSFNTSIAINMHIIILPSPISFHSFVAVYRRYTTYEFHFVLFVLSPF